MIISPSHAVSISSRAGTATAQFLKLEMGARHAAMGGTYAGYGSDVFTLWGQPAAVADAPERAWQVGGQHTEWFEGIAQEYVGLSGPLGRGRFGFVFNTVGVDDLVRTTEDATGGYLGSNGTFGARDYGVSLHYGLKLSEYLSLGGAARYIRSEIDNVEASTFAGDLGARLMVRGVEGLTLGASVTNAGPGMKFIRLKDDLPITFRGGAAYDLSPAHSLPVILAADVVKSIDRDVDAGVGAEWTPIHFLKLRGGYRTQGRDAGDGRTGSAGWTAGMGIRYQGLEIDYAYVPFGALGEAHRVSGGYLFGGGGMERLTEMGTGTGEMGTGSEAPKTGASEPVPISPLRKRIMK